MSWQDLFASHLGIGGSGFLAAVAMYKGASALESELRPSAVQEIGRFVSNASVSGDTFGLSRTTYSIFKSTFGEKHLSWICVRRSAAATVLFLLMFFFILMRITEGEIAVESGEFSEYSVAFIFIGIYAIALDYLALAKTRYILYIASKVQNNLISVVFLIADILLTSFFYLLILIIIVLLVDIDNLPTFDEFLETFKFSENHDYAGLFVHDSMLSNYMTAIWSFFMLFSILFLKILSYLSLPFRLMKQAFDVEKHPLRAIGLTVGGFVWIGSILVALL